MMLDLICPTGSKLRIRESTMSAEMSQEQIRESKNIVICCDGTGNQYGNSNSNVIKLYSVLVRDSEQTAYYHPGVGTIGSKNALTTAGKVWTTLRGLAFGYGLSENIADAYQFLMHTYCTGDRIFVFGFSRGAYTARALCGMLRLVGLLAPGNEGLIPYALRLYKSASPGFMVRIIRALFARPNKFGIAHGFGQTFCRACPIHFLGLWDTVSSVGWILDPIGLKPGRLPYTFDLENVSVVRHAVSIDERRAFFRQNLVRHVPGRDIKEVWFAGVHSDVGGSYPEAESGLSKISLRWMLREAVASGLKADLTAIKTILGADLAYAKPLYSAVKHNSLTLPWWLGEVWPKWTKHLVSPPGVEPPKFIGWPRANLFRRRRIQPGARIHESVLARKRLLPDYRPTNLPDTFTVDTDPQSERYPIRLSVGQTYRVGIHARMKWEDTALWVSKSEVYQFTASGRWYDASIPSGPEGYCSSKLVLRLFEPLRRYRKANWFALIGAIGPATSTMFVISDNSQQTMAEDGMLLCFANDVPFMYWNNAGWIQLTVARVN